VASTTRRDYYRPRREVSSEVGSSYGRPVRVHCPSPLATFGDVEALKSDEGGKQRGGRGPARWDTFRNLARDLPSRPDVIQELEAILEDGRPCVLEHGGVSTSRTLFWAPARDFLPHGENRGGAGRKEHEIAVTRVGERPGTRPSSRSRRR